MSPARTATNFNARTLDDPVLRQFLEQNLGYSLETWPLESWDFPKLTLAALYFHPSLDAARAQWRIAEAGVSTAGGRPKSRAHDAHDAHIMRPNLTLKPEYSSSVAPGISPWGPEIGADVPMEAVGKRGQRIAKAEYLAHAARLRVATRAWQVRATLRTNLLAYVAAQRSEALLRDLAAIQMELIRVGEQQPAADAVSYVELALLRIHLAKTRLALIMALREKMDFRKRVADSLGLPVRALLQVEVRYDFSRTAGLGLAARDLRRQALRSRSGILSALADYAAAETALRFEIAKRYPNIQFHPGCGWDQDKNRWAVNLNLEWPAVNRSRGPIAKAEARRIGAAAHLLSLQTEVIDEVDRSAAAYRATLDAAADIDTLVAAIRWQHDAVAARFKARAAGRLELLLTRLQLVAADLTQLDAQVKLQDALGSLEDAVQRPAELMDSLLSDRAR
ncbi:MAG: TolC family protein [Verrucomicrobiota bacterium]